MENLTLFKVLGGITRILQESETSKEAGRKMEMFLVDVADEKAITNFYDGMISETVERILGGG